MAQISISKVLAFRRRTKYLSILTTFLLIIIFGMMMQNGKNTVASNPSPYNTSFGSYGSGSGYFNYPQGLDLDGSGTVYVADTGNQRVQIFKSDGTFMSSFGSYGTAAGQFKNGPNGIAVDANGNIYVTDQGNGRAQVFNKDKVFIREITGLSSPYGIAVDNAGRIFITENGNATIAVYANDGAFVKRFGADRLSNPFAITIGQNNQIYVSDGTNRISIFDLNGIFISVFGSSGAGAGQFNNIYGIATDSSNKVYVADLYNARVQIFNDQGVYQDQFAMPFDYAGQTVYPWGISVSDANKIYVVDYYNHRVDLFSANSCYINVSNGLNVIPASCENKDITLDGVTMYADGVKVWQTNVNGQLAGAECSDSNNEYCDTKRHFRSLILKNGASITHSRITNADLVNPNNGQTQQYIYGDLLTKGTARWRKIDFSIAGTLDIQDSSRIDVSSKGYQGSAAYDSNNRARGYGAGHGYYPSVDNRWSSAGFGGAAGSTGTEPSNMPGSSYPSSFDSEFRYDAVITFDGHSYSLFDAGSGGGSNGNYDGGSGGGRIHISAGKLQLSASASIKADGGSVSYGAGAGGGSGGLIFLEAGRYVIANGNSQPNVAGGATMAAGQDGIMGYLYSQVAASTAISAIGGSGYYYGGAGGGRIVIKRSGDYPLANIQKKLLPLRRPDLGDDPVASRNFNPYAAQIGDEIIVSLTANNLAVNKETTLDDEIIVIPYSSVGERCDPSYMDIPEITNPIPSDATMVESGIYNTIEKKVHWVFMPLTDQITFTYRCKFVDNTFPAP